MTKYEFKKFPIIATVLTLLGLIAAVVAVTISLLNYNYDGTIALSLLEVVATVLVLAGLTTTKVGLSRVISIIITVCLLIVSFILAIDKYSLRDVYLFGIALFMLIASVLGLVYFLASKNPRIEKLFFITSIVMTSLVVVYTIVFIVANVSNHANVGTDLAPQTYAILISYAFITILPAIIHRSMDKVEVVEEDDDDMVETEAEQPAEEPKEIEEKPQEEVEKPEE